VARSIPSVPRHTRRLELRPFRRRDAEALISAVGASIDELVQWLPWAHRGYGRSEAVRFIRESNSAWAEGRAFDFTIRWRDESRPRLGNLSVWHTSRRERSAEIGYWVRSDATAQGIAAEAAARVVQIAIDELGLHRVTLRIATGNRASERVAEKLGFTREGLLRKEVLVAGEWMDHSLWAILDEEFRAGHDRFIAAGLLP
jgi:ribosomal-protein-serine acetyltransferase